MVQGTCSIPGCGLQGRIIRGWCMAHYNRWIRHGDPLPTVTLVKRDYSRTEAERFWSKVDRSGECWEWTAFRNPKGYGVFNFRGATPHAHRVAYILTHGSVPPGLVIDHLCRNRGCCNPVHLEAVTVEENTRRGEAGTFWSDRTHCPKGHPYDAANTGVQRRRGVVVGRFCKTCQRAAVRRYQERKRHEQGLGAVHRRE